MELKAEIHPEKSPLSAKENEQLLLMAQGKKATEIERIIHRSSETVKTHRRNMMRKLGAFHAIEALAVAVAKGIVTYRNNLLVICLVGSSVFNLVVPSDIYAGDLSSPFAPVTELEQRHNRVRQPRPPRSSFGRRGKRENEG